MAVNPLPPQAYTKETLQKAYTWLLSQSASIKEMASSQDMMISLYLKAQRNGDASLETPSIQNFKQELKSLAGIMGDLQVPYKASNNLSNSYYQTAAQPPTQSIPPSHMGTPAATTSMASQSLPSSSTMQPYFAPQPANLNQMSASVGPIDSVSLQYLNEVKQGLNLSSDAEALRALIAMGYKQFKKM